MHCPVRPSAASTHCRTRLDSQAWVCVFSQSKQCSDVGSGKPLLWTLAVVAASVQCLQTVGIHTANRVVLRDTS